MAEDIADQIARVREFAEETATAAASTVKRGARSASKQVRAAKDTASTGVKSAQLHAGKAADVANRLITEHPVAATAAAVMVGATLAWLFPKSSRAVVKQAPKIASKLSRTIADAQKATKAALPVDDVVKPVVAAASTLSKAARSAPEAALRSARAQIETLRDKATDAISHSDLADQAANLLERVGDGATKWAERVKSSTNQPKK